MPQGIAVRSKRLTLFICAVAQIGASVAQPITAPWRSDDATLISLCFDGLGKESQVRLRGQNVSDGSANSVTFELVGHTTTGRPMYEALLAHPQRFRAVLFDLPGGGVARFDRPEKLENAIEASVYSVVPLQCVASEQFPAATSILSGASVPMATCPDLGVNVSYRVVNGPGYGSGRVLDRQRGFKLFNGLRGCREFIYRN